MSFAVIILKVEHFGFMTVVHPKDADRMANSVDPDPTRSSLIWIYSLPRLAIPKTWDHYDRHQRFQFHIV